MTAKQKRAMPTWAYAALVLLAIVFFALAIYLKEHSQRDDERSRVADALQQHSRVSDSNRLCKACAIIRSESNQQVIYIPAGILDIISALKQESSHGTTPLFGIIGMGTL
jgi:hypothetical protein